MLNDSEAQLKTGALKFPSLLMQGITHIAPAVGLVLTIQVITASAGVASPLAYLMAFAIIMTLGISLTQLAKYLPSAGGYYTYVGRTVHPRAGFLTAWIYFLYDPTAAAINLAFMGYFLDGTLKKEYGLHFPWWLFFLVSTTFITFLVYRGIEISARTMAVLASAEICIVLGLGITSLFKPGSGGINLSSYSVTDIPSFHGLYLGVVYSIFAFTGFESVAPLAEETENPLHTLPQGIIVSILLMGAFYLFSSWAVLIGWGTNHVGSFVQAHENPVFLLAHHLWGSAWILLLLAVLNSVIAICIAGTNAATRVFFAMGRSGSLPSWLGRVHPRFKTPTNAIWLQTLITLFVGLGLGFWLGPAEEFYLMGVAITLGLALVYGAGNLGVILFYRGEKRNEFNWLLHAIFPLISTAGLTWVGFKSVDPLPQTLVKYAPVLVAVWLAIGVAIMWILSRSGQESWLLKAQQTAYEDLGGRDQRIIPAQEGIVEAGKDC